MARANGRIVGGVVAFSLMSIAGVAACSTSARSTRNAWSIVALGDSGGHERIAAAADVAVKKALRVAQKPRRS